MDEKDKMLEQINDKLNAAPDASYKIGVIIGQMLPFVVLVALAYLLFSYMKNKSNDKDDILKD
ncbi:hypothetical protein [Capnocytophaga catalasegens]|uniref:Uncharacterized protein n=1 Tax=Capnocytophaga catalasegens TaxID=1004260 RepID=A0AAV5AWS5_9FLAO|nr:hypothetical protein [Capnocytophaga catalasegens]GIZ15798.1 hypothetical protein RCZ03_17980 [Capnocytophaga catalasegens]GJM49810.1 hypothetical protein RCZ15_07850 [Capnocytophaga catalasegens]GJM52975.1 hypothetical protein RCZ16_12920 [Capnocytophaga catalasegens]